MSDDRLARLRVLRGLLADAVANGVTGPLAKEYRETLREIAALEKAQPKGSIVDDLAFRRKTRRSGPSGDVAAGGDRRE